MASEPLPFSFYDASAVPTTAAATPPHASVHGGSQVLVAGGGYRPVGAALQCRVGGVAVPAVFVSVTSASCVMPPYAARWGDAVTVEVCVTADYGATYGACGARVTYYDPSRPPALGSVSPEFVKADDAWASTTLTLRGSNFAPTSRLACHVATTAAEAGSAASERSAARFVSWGEVECDAPQRGWHEAAFLSVTHDGATWAAPLPLTYFKTAELRRTSPAAAERRAASTELTLEAAHLFARAIGGRFHTNLLCRLTPLRHPVPNTPPPAANFTTDETFVVPAELVGSSEARCSVPAAAAARTLWVQLSTSAGLEYTPYARAHRLTQYDTTARANLSTAAPNYAPLAGAAVVLLRGANLSPRDVHSDGVLRCAFGPHSEAGATFESPGMAACRAPAAAPFAPHSVDLSLRFGAGAEGGEYGSVSRLFTYYDDTRAPSVAGLTPAYADIALRTPLRIRGGNFAPTPQLACSYSTSPLESDLVPASFVSVDEVRCLSPEVLPSFTEVFEQASVRVTTNGVDWSSESATFTYFTSPVVSGLEPQAGDRAASHALTVKGDHFFELRSADHLAYGAQGAYNLFCKFGLDECGGDICGANVPATYVDEQTIRCDTPKPNPSPNPLLLA